LYRSATLVGIALLGGCGFHLQGALKMPAAMQRTYVEAVDSYSLFHRELRLRLEESGIQLVDTPEEATAILSIVTDNTGQRVLSVSARNVPTEYEVYYTVRYSVSAGDTTLLKSQDVTETRDYTYDETLVLGKAHEEAVLREAIAKDLVRIVLKQVSSL
jgi:LPS-assembly lipoprotein